MTPLEIDFECVAETPFLAAVSRRADGLRFESKNRGDPGALYILRCDEISATWQLTMYTSVRARALFERHRSRPLFRETRQTPFHLTEARDAACFAQCVV